MKIMISPSKTQIQNTIFLRPGKPMLHQQKTLDLFHLLKVYSKEDLAKLMKLKNDLLEHTYRLYQEFTPDAPMISAIDCYTGVVFHEIKKDTYNESQVGYMNEHLVILSAMYGILTPDTRIWPYRLDMTMRPKNTNLYTYWKSEVEDFFKEEEWIVNLASGEFSKMLHPFRSQWIDIGFFEKKPNGELTTVSVNAKKARGAMVHYMILNQVKDIEDIKKFEIYGYQWDETRSDDRNYVFVK